MRSSRTRSARLVLLGALYLALSVALGAGPAGAAETEWEPHSVRAPLPDCPPSVVPGRRASCRKPWAVLVYMAADNDLLPYALWDLYEMEAGYRSGRAVAGSTDRADLVVQVLAPEAPPLPPEARRIHVEQQNAMPYDDALGIEDFARRTLDDVRSPVVARVPRTRGDGRPVPAAADFERFVEWGLRAYPARHTMVVVWGHGQGWAPSSTGPLTAPASFDFALRPFGGLAFSDSTGTALDIPGLHQALRRAEAATPGGARVDVYASDACLMQMVEVATEISDAARFIVGSSQVQNYLGLPYRRLMFELNSGRFADERTRFGIAGDPAREADEPLLLARMLPRIFQASLARYGLHGRALPEALATETMSSLDADALAGALVPALRDLARAGLEDLAADPYRAIAETGALADAPGFMGGSADLGTFLPRLDAATEGRLHAPVAATQDALARTVIARALGPRYEQGGYAGLALWLPATPAELRARLPDFESSAFYGGPGGTWSRWLRAVLGD